MADERPLETGWLPDTPVDDTLMRRFLFNQVEVNEAIAGARGRTERTDDVAFSDSQGPVFFFNQAILLRPLTGLDDSLLDTVDAFYAKSRHACSLLSLWPTPDLGRRGWSLVGHPAFVARGPFPYEHEQPADVEVVRVRTVDDMTVAERIFVDGYPMPEASGLPPGTILPPELLDGPLVLRLGVLDGEPVACGIGHVALGVDNLCGGATMPAARRRGVWESLVWARVADAPTLPAVAFTSDYSRPGFERMGFLPTLRLTMWARWQ